MIDVFFLLTTFILRIPADYYFTKPIVHDKFCSVELEGVYHIDLIGDLRYASTAVQSLLTTVSSLSSLNRC